MFNDDKSKQRSRHRYINDLYLLVAIILFAGVVYLIVIHVVPAYGRKNITVSARGMDDSPEMKYPLSDDGFIAVVTCEGYVTRQRDDTPAMSQLLTSYLELDRFISISLYDMGADYNVIDSANGIFEIDTDNIGINIIAVKDGKAYMAESNCPDLTCVHTAPIPNSTGAIVCLPHGITVSGSSDGSDEVDTVTW